MAKQTKETLVLPPTVDKIYTACIEILGDMAHEHSLAITLSVCEKLADVNRVYIPSDRKVKYIIDLQRRNNKIHAEFDGTNHKALARQYALTERQVRNILNYRDSQYEQPCNP